MSSLKSYPRSKKQPAWLFQYRDLQTGKWTQRVLHCTAEQAKAYQRKFDADYNYLKMHPEQIGTDPAEYTIKYVADIFINSKAADKAFSTIDRYRNVFDNIYKHFGESYPLKFIDSGAIQSFTLFYLQDHTKHGTNLALRHLKAFLRWCSDMEYISKVPKIAMLKIEVDGIRWLTREEYEKIYSEALPEMRDIMTLCISTGARINEILNCPWGKIKFKEKVIVLNPAQVKGRRLEALYLNDKCLEILKRIKSEQNPAKPSPFPYPYDYAKWRYKKACELAGIKSTLHDLRRSAGAWLLQNGVAIYQVSKFLRHSSVTVTEKSYADLVKKNYSDLSDKIIEILS